MCFSLSHLDWCRLRRAVLHPHLVLSKDDADRLPSLAADNGAIDVDALEVALVGESHENAYTGNVLTNLAQMEGEECPICLDLTQIPMIIPPCMHQWWVILIFASCSHIYFFSCKHCILNYIETCRENGKEGSCPMCSSGPLKVFAHHPSSHSIR